MKKTISKITNKVSGVEKSRNAPQDSEVRILFRDCAEYSEDETFAERFRICAECDKLKEEFKLFGITIKDMTPTCGECGCNLNLKIPMYNMSCPIGKW